MGFRRKHNIAMTQLLCLRMGHSARTWALIRRRKEQTDCRQTKGPCSSLPKAQGRLPLRMPGATDSPKWEMRSSWGKGNLEETGLLRGDREVTG